MWTVQAADGDNLLISLVTTHPGEDSESRSSALRQSQRKQFTGNSQCLLEPGHASRDSPVFLWRKLSPLLVETLICCCCFSIIIIIVNIPAPRNGMYLGGLPQDVNVLVLPGVHVLTQEPQKLRQACLAPGSR